MSFSIWPTAFVARFTTVTAAFLNQVRTQIAAAIDGVAGGIYAPSSAVDIRGSGFAGNLGGQVAQRQDATTLTDGNHTIDVSKDTWIGAATQTAARVWTLRHSTSPVPRVGARILAIATAVGGPASVAFKREDATLLSTIAPGTGWALFEYTSVGWVTIAFGGTTTYSA